MSLILYLHWGLVGTWTLAWQQKVWQLLVLLGWSILFTLGLAWYRNSKRDIGTRDLNTCHISEYTWWMFTNNCAHVTARNAMYFCSFRISWPLLHTIVCVDDSWKVLYLIFMLQMWEVIEIQMLIRIAVCANVIAQWVFTSLSLSPLL